MQNLPRAPPARGEGNFSFSGKFATKFSRGRKRRVSAADSAPLCELEQFHIFITFKFKEGRILLIGIR